MSLIVPFSMHSMLLVLVWAHRVIGLVLKAELVEVSDYPCMCGFAQTRQKPLMNLKDKNERRNVCK